MGINFCIECGADIRGFDGKCPYCEDRTKSQRVMTDEERELSLKAILNTPPPGLLNPDGTLPMYLLKEREDAARELEEIKKRNPQTEPTIKTASTSAEDVGKLWRCECGAENMGTFCIDCGRGKP